MNIEEFEYLQNIRKPHPNPLLGGEGGHVLSVLSRLIKEDNS